MLELLHCFNVPKANEEAGDDPENDKSLVKCVGDKSGNHDFL